jgi:hypothetical protein
VKSKLVTMSLEGATAMDDRRDRDDDDDPASVHLSAAIARGKLTSAEFFSDPQMKTLWATLSAHGDYDVTVLCRESLVRLMAVRAWQEAVQDVRSVVWMGAGGSSLKDRLLIDGLLAHVVGRFRMVLVDINDAMLAAARDDAARAVAERGAAARVDLDAHRANFLALTRAVALGRKKGAVLWSIPGGTLGNLDEEEFFAGLAPASAARDLLQIGVRVLGCPEHCGGTRDAAPSTYLSPAVRAFAAARIRSLAADAGLTVDDIAAGNAVDVGRADNCSKVPGARSTEISTRALGQPVTLIRTTAYDLEGLVAFFAVHGWALLGSASSEEHCAGPYRQILFRRETSLHTGRDERR